MRRFEFLVWGGLVAAMAAVVAVYVVGLGRHRSGDTLPVLGKVTPFALTNQFGLTVTGESLSDYVWVADIIFTRCPGQCHQMTQLLRRVQERLPKGAPVRMVSLTADPVHDSPDVLHRYGSRYGYESATWHFLTGTKEAVYRLAMEGLLLSVTENPAADLARLDELFLHSSAFVVVDGTGRLRGVVHLEDEGAEDRILRLVENVLLSDSER